MSGATAPGGEVLFARYAYPPNELGYCGSGDGDALLDVAAGLTSGDVARRAPGFDGAWPYLEVIADTTGIADPLDRRVVEAYWVGNDLLVAVPHGRFADQVRQRFGDQAGADWGCLDPVVVPPPLPHHSFHVLTVYPWTSLLRRTGAPHALRVLDRCRIRWGRVLDVHAEHLEVLSQPLTWDGAALTLGPAAVEHPRWASAGRSLQRAAGPGDWVSMHWDWVCDTLDPAQLADLRSVTARQLAATNATTAPADATASAAASGGDQQLAQRQATVVGRHQSVAPDVEAGS